MKLTRRTVVQAVAEATYGTDPGSGYVGLLTKTGSEVKVGGETITRETLRNTLSPRGHVVGSKQTELTLPLEFRGAGDAGAGALNTPEIDVLLKACSMARETGLVIIMSGVAGSFEIGETVTNDTQANAVGTVADIDGTTLFIRALTNAPTDTDAISGDTSGATATVVSSSAAYVYRPDSPDLENMGSVTIHYYVDGIRHVTKAARGSFSIDMTVGQIPSINFSISGTYGQPTDATNPSPSYLSLVPSPVVGASLKIGSLDMTLVTVNALTFDIANDVQPRDDIQAPDGRVGYVVTGRDPKGSIDPEVSSIANFDPYSDWSGGALVPISAGIGDTFGNRVRVVMPATQYTELPYGERNGIATYALGYRATGTDDEMMIIYW